MLKFRVLRLLQKIILPWLSFSFNDATYCYWIHLYNSTWANERAVEVPIFQKILATARTKKVLEIGNVLSHYQPIEHAVLDKYEVAPGVINQDLVNFSPKRKFDLILSISTLEHIGVDEEPRQPKKATRALKRIKTLLAMQGVAYVSIPLGYNPVLDQLIFDDSKLFTAKWFLKRNSWLNTWSEAELTEVKRSKYGWPFPNANAVFIGQIKA